MGSNGSREMRIDGATLRAAYNRVVYERLGSMSLGVAIIFTIFSVVNMYTLPEKAVVRTAVYDISVVVLFLVTWVLFSRSLIPQRAANPFVAALSLFVISNILHTFYMVPDAIYAVDTTITIIVTSMVILSFRWLLLVICVGSAAWVLIAWSSMAVDDLIRYGFSFMAAGVVSLFIQATRRLSNRRMERLRIQGERDRQTLEQSLENTKREIEDRKRAEAEKARLEGKLIQAQKMEAVGRLAGGVAHDINNMLAAIKGCSELMLLEAPPSSTQWEDLKTVLAACKRGKELTQNLLGFARQGKYRRERISVNSLITDALTFLTRTMPQNIVLETALYPELRDIVGDPGQMNQVLVNLLINAVDALNGNGRITVRTENERIGPESHEFEMEMLEGEYVRITVSDDGVGMDEETMLKAFEPFFTKKTPGEGTGLGLSMVYGTVKNHGGYVFIKSRLGEGTSVTVFLPVFRGDSVPAGAESSVTAGVASGAGTVLLVDDEPLVRRSAKRILSTLGYEVIQAENGKVAVEKYEENRERVSVVILDLMMPVMDGEEAFKALKRIDPAVKVLFASGYTKDKIANDLLIGEDVNFVQKPFSIDELSTGLKKITYGDAAGA
jgi:signal transduction histidine kinase/ActR/RegA family two-component response regulator